METGTVTHRECFGHRMPLGTGLPGICPLGFSLSMMETVRLFGRFEVSLTCLLPL